MGLVAIWLIVTSTSEKWIKVGMLAGFWALLGAYFVVGGRHPAQPAAPSGQELEVREKPALERTEDAAARREYEARLVQLLRHEIQAGLSGELDGLRADVAALRTELLDKVGGQLRLERIETTRIIGSDIEALQHEVNQLKIARQGRELDALLPRLHPFVDVAPELEGPAVTPAATTARIPQAEPDSDRLYSAQHPGPNGEATSGGGRRRHESDGDNDVLRQILLRERAH